MNQMLRIGIGLAILMATVMVGSPAASATGIGCPPGTTGVAVDGYGLCCSSFYRYAVCEKENDPTQLLA
jgi:hypothetical protein